MISFFIDPTAAREAVLSGRGLLVEITANSRRVTVMEIPRTTKGRE